MNMTNSDAVETNKNKGEISWSAILAGAIIAITLSILLNIFNLSFGLAAAQVDQSGMTQLAVSSIIWLSICAFVSMYIAGWFTGRILLLDAPAYKNTGIHHALIAWSLALIITFMLSANMVGQLYIGSSIYMAQNSVAKELSQQSQSPGSFTNQISENITSSQSPRTAKAAQTSHALGGIGFFVLFILLLGAFSAALGGYRGARMQNTKAKINL